MEFVASCHVDSVDFNFREASGGRTTSGFPQGSCTVYVSAYIPEDITLLTSTVLPAASEKVSFLAPFPSVSAIQSSYPSDHTQEDLRVFPSHE